MTLQSRSAAAAFIATPILFAGAAFGADEVPSVVRGINEGVLTGILTLVVFAVAFAIMATQVWPRILKGLEERSEKIRQEIAAAEDARQQAREALEQYEQSLAQARAEAQKMIDKAKADQTRVVQELKANAETEVSKMKDRAMRDIEATRRAAVAEIYHEAAALSTTIASKLMAREISGDDQDRLLEESLQELRSAAGTPN